MSGLLANPCCGCGNKIQPSCEWTDNFDNPQSYFWYSSTTIGANEAGFSLVGETLKTVGDGSITVETNLPTGDQPIFVEAILYLGLGGLTIRRADSSESVRLIKVGELSSSSHQFELWHGSTKLSELNWEFPMIVMRLELESPLAGTATVKAMFSDGFAPMAVLASHSITFAMPDKLHVGVITNGEVTYDDLKVSPCPSLQCHPWSTACPHESELSMIVPPPDAEPPAVPISWSFDMPEPTNNTGGGCDETNMCREYRGKWTLLRYDKVTEFREFGYAAVEWYQAAPHIVCGWAAIIDNRDPGPETCLGNYYLTNYDNQLRAQAYSTMPHDKFPRRFISCCRSPEDFQLWNTGPLSKPTAWAGNTSLHKQYETYNLSVAYENHGTIEHPKYCYIFGLQATINTPQSPPWRPQAVWTSDPIYWRDHEAITNAITFNFRPDLSAISTIQQVVCLDWASSITLTPNGNFSFAKIAAECSNNCGPLALAVPGRCYMTHLSFVAPDGATYDYTIPMGVTYDEENNNYYWEAQTLASYPYTHPVCGNLPINLRVKIHCVEPQEGYDKIWVMDIFNDDEEMSRFPVQWDESSPGYEFPYWEGETGVMCSDAAQTWDFYASRLDIVDTTAKFGFCEWSVCASPRGHSIYMSYSHWCEGDVPGGSYTEGGLLFQLTGSIPPSANASSIDGDVYFSPLNLGEVGGIFLWSEAGIVHAQLVDGHLAAIPGLGSVYGASHSCDPTTGQLTNIQDIILPYAWSNSTDPFGVCSGAFGWGEFALYYVHS